jgi:Spy/CpxP family protein refolding chaperone
MKRQVASTAFGIAAALASASMAGAQPAFEPERPPARSPVLGPGRMAVLGLTYLQRQQVRVLFEASRPQMEALFVEVQESRQALEEAAGAESPDPARVGELYLDLRRLREQGRAQREQMDEALRELLTPEQRRKLDLLETARAVGMDHRGPEGMGPPPEGDGRMPEPR